MSKRKRCQRKRQFNQLKHPKILLTHLNRKLKNQIYNHNLQNQKCPNLPNQKLPSLQSHKQFHKYKNPISNQNLRKNPLKAIPPKAPNLKFRLLRIQMCKTRSSRLNLLRIQNLKPNLQILLKNLQNKRKRLGKTTTKKSTTLTNWSLTSSLKFLN